jgi:hypothetical protein
LDNKFEKELKRAFALKKQQESQERKLRYQKAKRERKRAEKQ